MRKLSIIILTLAVVFLSFSTYRKTPFKEETAGVELVNHNNIDLNRPEPRNNSHLMMKSTSRQSDEWEVVGSWPYGACNTVIADSNYIYIGTGGMIIIADMTDPSAPVEMSRIGTPGAVWKLFRSGNFLYVANKMGGLRIIDVSDPLSPVEVGSFEKPHWGWECARDVYVLGSYAYVAMGGLYVLDVSDPYNPLEVAHLDTSWSWDIYVSSNYAYMTSSRGLLIFDVSDPSNPVEINNYGSLHCEARVYISNGYAYVTNTSDGFYIIDVNNLSDPVEVAHLYTSPDWVWDVHGSGSYVYVATHDSGLHILDVSDPSNPKEVGSYHDVSADWEDLYVYNNYAYMTFSDGGLRIIDVSDPSNPKKTGFLSTSGTAFDAFVSGRYAYVANGDFHILDVSDPSNPKEVGSVIPVDIEKKDAWCVHASGNYAYVNGFKPCLRILDVSDRSNPVEIGGNYSIDIIGLAASYGLFISGNYAYLLGFYSGLHIIDISDPSSPVEVGNFDASGARGIYVYGNYAYVTYADTGMPDNYQGLHILDVSDPSNPTQVGSIDIPTDCTGVYVSSGYAYVACDSLRIIDVSDPSNPTEVASYYKPPGAIMDVNVSSDYAYVACVPFGVFILDVSDPSNPVEVANINKMEAWGVHVYCGYTYVVDTDFGVIIIKNIDDNILHTLLLASESGGTTDPLPGTYTYNCGTEVTIKAIPESGYRFSEWSGDASGTDNPTTINVDSDKSVTANFIRQYTLTVSAGTGGSTDPSPGTYTHDSGAKVTVKAIANTGYNFSGWSGDASGTTNPITITMDKDKTVTASFTATSSGDTGGDSGGGGGCFIATACYGTPMAEEVKTLCAFRDQYLVNSSLGRAFIELYYSYSPKVADFIRQREYLKAVVREFLRPIVWIIALLGINS